MLWVFSWSRAESSGFHLCEAILTAAELGVLSDTSLFFAAMFVVTL